MTWVLLNIDKMNGSLKIKSISINCAYKMRKGLVYTTKNMRNNGITFNVDVAKSIPTNLPNWVWKLNLPKRVKLKINVWYQNLLRMRVIQ